MRGHDYREPVQLPLVAAVAFATGSRNTTDRSDGDIASSARTMIETVNLLRRNGRANPVCVVVHPIFADDAYTRLLDAGPARIVSTNSIPHPSNGIDISEALAEGVIGLV